MNASRKPTKTVTISPRRQAAYRKKNTHGIKPGYMLTRLFSVFLLSLLAVSLSWFGWHWLQQSQYLTIRHIVLEAVQADGKPSAQLLHYVDKQQLQKVVANHVQGNLLTVDMQAIQQAVAQLPWIKQVHIRRRWPDTLSFQIQEYHPLAYWQGDDETAQGILDQDGQIFTLPQTYALPALPLLSGGQSSIPALLMQYKILSPLLEQAGLPVQKLSQNHQHNWQLQVANGSSQGLKIILGYSQHPDGLKQRIKRFIKYWSQKPQKIKNELEYADLRYQTGLVVKWKKL